jgi:hypothetical protein
MKTNNLYRFATGIACAAIIFACNKNNANSGASTMNSELQTQADDQTMVSNESDAVSNDANTAMYSSPSIAGNSIYQVNSGVTTNGVSSSGGSTNLDRLICDATIVMDTVSSVKTITITYDGTNCWGNRTRTGVVVITVPVGEHWKDPMAKVTVSIQDLKITRLRDDKSITINGTRVFTNVTGGHLADLSTLGSITHTDSGSMSITFPNSSTRSWNVSKQRVYTYDNGIVMTTTGTYADNSGNTGIAEWGSNRFGVSFESEITAPKVIRQDCDFRLVSGENTILRSDNITTTITYGLDATGTPTSCPGAGSYYYKVVRANANTGLSFTKILPY